MLRKAPLFGCFCGGVATASPSKANIHAEETAGQAVPLDDVVHITAGASAEKESHHQPAGAELACVVLPPICVEKLPCAYDSGCQESPLATKESHVSSLSSVSPLASGSARSGTMHTWQNARGGPGSATGSRQNVIFFENPLAMTGDGDESPASEAQPTADAENIHMLRSKGQPPAAEIARQNFHMPVEAAAASPAPRESPDKAPGTTQANAVVGCDGRTDTCSPGQRDGGRKSQEWTASAGLVPSLLSEAEEAASEEWEPSLDCPYSAEAHSTNKVIRGSPKSVSKVDTDEGPMEPSCTPALTSILNGYLESDVPLTHRQRFPSTAVGSEDMEINEKGSHASSPLSTTSTYYSPSTVPDTVNSSTSSMRRSLSYATTGIRQSLETKQASPVKRPSLVPSLRLSALGLGKAKDADAENGGEAEINSSLNLSAGYTPPPLVRSGTTEDASGGMCPIPESAGTDAPGITGTQEAAEDIKTVASLKLAELKLSPLGNASSRMNSAVNSPSSRATSPHNSIRINRFINESPKSMVESPFAPSHPISNPATPKHMLGSDAFSLRMNAMEQSRQFSLKGAAAIVSTSSPGGNRRRRARNAASSLEDEENLVPKSASPSNQNTTMGGTDGSIKGMSDVYRGTEHGTAQHRYHLLKLSADVRDSLVEIGGCDSTCETPMTYDETPSLEACQTPAVLPQALERALEQRAAGRQRQRGDELESVHPNSEEVPEHVQASGYLVHNNGAFASVVDEIVIQPHGADDMESEEGDSIVAWEASTELSESEPPQESRIDGFEGPSASEEPHVRGSRRGWIDKPPDRVNPLRKEMAHDKNAMAKKSLASAGSFSLYANKAFQEQQEESSGSVSVFKAGASSPSQVRCSQIFRSLSDIVAARAQGLAPETKENNGGSTAHILEDAVFSGPGHQLALPGEPISGGAAKEITPLVNRAPAPVGLTPRVENLTPRTAETHGLPKMTPRTTSTMNSLLHDRSLGSTFDLLANGDARSKEAAAGALYRMSQQECHKMAMCRLEGGLELLAASMKTLETATGRRAAAGSLCSLASHPGCRAVVADRGGVQAFVGLTASNLPEDQLLAARGLSYIATLDPKRSHILDAGGAYALTCLLDAVESRVREAAARALWNLAHTGEDCRQAIAEAGCVQTLLEMSKGENRAEAAAAAGALWNLAASTQIQEAIAKQGGIPVMVSLFQEEGNPGAKVAAAGALCNLMLLKSNRPAVLESGVVRSFVEALQCSPPSMKPTVARALYVLACDEPGCSAITAAGGCQPLTVEVANGNEMAAWALKGLMSQDVSRNAVLRAGGIQAFLSVLRSPSSKSTGLEAATWAIKVLTDPPGSSHCHLVLEAGGLSTLLISISSSHASLSSKEGATRALWNLVFQEECARSELAQAHNLTHIVRLLMDETAAEVCQAGAGVLLNLSSNPETRQNVFSTGGADALLKVVAACGNGNDTGFTSVRALCSLSEDRGGAEALVSAGAVEILAKRLSPGEGKPAPQTNALVVALYNCLQARSALSNRPSGTDELAHAVSSLVDACREGNAAVRPLALKALRGLVGDLDVAELAVKARVVEGLGDLLAGVYAASLDLEDGIAIKVYGRLLDEAEICSSVWILEGLAFLEAGQKSIVMHSPLLQALVQVLRRDRTEEQRAAARIIHNLSANSSLDLGPLHATPGLLPALVYLAGNPDVPANVRESAAWSIKALTATGQQRLDLIDLHGVKAICNLLSDPGSTHGSHQAAALVLRNLATSPENVAAIHAEGVAPIRCLVSVLRGHEDQGCCGAAASALANLSASDSLKRTILESGGARGLVGCLSDSNVAIRQAAARAIANMAYHCPEAADAMLASQGAHPLLAMLSSTDKNMFVADIATAALAINNMAAHPSARLALVKAGVVKVLVASLERVSGELDNDARESARKAGVSSAPEESCVRALWSLAPEPAAAAQIASEGAVAMLLGLLSQSANTKIRHGVAAACNGALRVLTGSDANRQAVVEGGALEQLVAVLRSDPSPEAAEVAALSLWDLAVKHASATVVAEAGGIPALIGLLCCSRPNTRHAAAGALHNLAFGDKNKDAIVNAGGLEILVGLLTPRTPECCAIAANTLKILALQPSNKARILQCGGIRALSDLLDSGSGGSREAAAGALRNLATSKANKAAIVEAGSLPHLIAMLSKESLDGQNASAGALCNISFNSSPAVKESIVKAGALPPLVRLLASVARHVPAGGSPDKPAAAELAARCVWNLASGSDANRQMIARVGGVGALVLAVKDGPPRMQAIAAGALSHLAVDDNLKDDIREAGGVPVLGAVVCQGAEAEGFHGAASVLRNLAALPSAKSAIVKAGLVPALLEMMFQGSSQEERDSAKAILRNLAFNSEEHASIVQQLAGEGCSVDELLA